MILKNIHCKILLDVCYHKLYKVFLHYIFKSLYVVTIQYNLLNTKRIKYIKFPSLKIKKKTDLNTYGYVAKKHCGNEANIKYFDLKNWLYLIVLVFELELSLQNLVKISCLVKTFYFYCKLLYRSKTNLVTYF